MKNWFSLKKSKHGRNSIHSRNIILLVKFKNLASFPEVNLFKRKYETVRLNIFRVLQSHSARNKLFKLNTQFIVKVPVFNYSIVFYFLTF